MMLMKILIFGYYQWVLTRLFYTANGAEVANEPANLTYFSIVLDADQIFKNGKMNKKILEKQMGAEHFSRLEFLEVRNFHNQWHVDQVDKFLDRFEFDHIFEIGDPSKTYTKPLVNISNNHAYFMPLKKLRVINFYGKNKAGDKLPAVLFENNYGDCEEPKQSAELVERFGENLISVMDTCDCETLYRTSPNATLERKNGVVCTNSDTLHLVTKEDRYKYLNVRVISGSINIVSRNHVFYLPRLEKIICLQKHEPAVKAVTKVTRKHLNLPSLRTIVGCRTEFEEELPKYPPSDVVEGTVKVDEIVEKSARKCNSSHHPSIYPYCEHFEGDMRVNLKKKHIYRNIRTIKGRITVADVGVAWDFSFFEKLEVIQCANLPNKSEEALAAIYFQYGTGGWKGFNFPRLVALPFCSKVYESLFDVPEIESDFKEVLNLKYVQRQRTDRASRTRYYGDLAFDDQITPEILKQYSAIREVVGGQIRTTSKNALEDLKSLKHLRLISCDGNSSAASSNFTTDDVIESRTHWKMFTEMDCTPNRTVRNASEEKYLLLNTIDPAALEFLNPVNQVVRTCDRFTTHPLALLKCTRFEGTMVLDGSKSMEYLELFRNIEEVYGGIQVKNTTDIKTPIMQKLKKIVCAFPNSQEKRNYTNSTQKIGLVVDLTHDEFKKSSQLRKLEMVYCDLHIVTQDATVSRQENIFGTATFFSRIGTPNCVISQYNVGLNQLGPALKKCHKIHGDIVIDGRIEDELRLSYWFERTRIINGDVYIQNMIQPASHLLKFVSKIKGVLHIYNSPNLFNLSLALTSVKGFRIENSMHMCRVLEKIRVKLGMPEASFESDCNIEPPNWKEKFVDKTKIEKEKLDRDATNMPLILACLMILLCGHEILVDVGAEIADWIHLIPKEDADTDDEDDEASKSVESKKEHVIVRKKKEMKVALKKLSHTPRH